MIPVTRIASRWWLDRSQEVRGLVLGVQAAEAAHPGKTIVLDGITSDLYNASLADSALTSVGLKEAYLTPAAGDTIHPVNDLGRLPAPRDGARSNEKSDHPRRGCGILRCRRSPPEHYGGLGAVSFRFASRPGTPSDRSRESLAWLICSVPNGFRWRTAFAGCPRGQLCTWVVQGRPKISCFSKAIARGN